MNFNGILIGVFSFLVIGTFHPIVIKCEYYFTSKIWPLFLLAGIGLCVLSVFVKNPTISIMLAITACSCFWSILELKQQTKRVEKGWFPENPKRKKEGK